MARGINAAGDLPVAQLLDGSDAAQLFKDYVEVVKAQNDKQDTLVSLLTFKTTLASDAVLQSIDAGELELASEYGQPVGIRPGLTSITLGYKFDWYDLATRMTARWLADASKEQADALTNAALAADNKTTFKAVMGSLFNNTARVNEQGVAVQPLWNNDGTVPPPHDGKTFAATHQHYVTSGTANLTAAGGQIAVDALIENVREHGYDAKGGQLLLLVNRQEANQIRGFRAGASGSFDFIPGEGAPARITSEVVVGQTPPAKLGEQPLIGAYGPAWVAENNLIPAGYVVCVVTRGTNSSQNPIGFREHPTTNLRGLRIVPGPNPDYPLTSAFYVRGFGVGVRHRGAAAVMQVTASPTYTAPAGF